MPLINLTRHIIEDYIDKDVVIIFSAPWCTPCKALKRRLEEADVADILVYNIDTLLIERDVSVVPTTCFGRLAGANDDGDYTLVENKEYEVVGADFKQIISNYEAWRAENL